MRDKVEKKRNTEQLIIFKRQKSLNPFLKPMEWLLSTANQIE
jgi:hypothetical protein